MVATLEFGTPKHAYGAIYWSAGAAVDPDPNTPIKVGGTTAAMGGNYDVTQATTNRLTYTGVTTRNFRVSANFSIDLGGAATLIMHIYKGGAANSPPISTNRTVGGTDIG